MPASIAVPLRPFAATALAAAAALLLNACALPASSGHASFAGLGADAPRTAQAGTLLRAAGASVVDIATLRIGRDESLPELDLEISPEADFGDRLAWPLPASARLSLVRDLGSGVIISPDGLILTSAHVINATDEVRVRLDDGRRFDAEVIGIDRRTDVALLKIPADGLPVARMGDSSRVAVGDWVAAIGAPFGFHGSVTTGVVSARDRFIAGAGEIPFIQTDAAINPGSSGSPLFNAQGEVIALNSMIYSGSGGYMGLSFAVPINLALKVAAQLRDSGRVRRALLGAELQELTPALAAAFGLARPAGALVVRVSPDGPAAAAGLQRGDVILSMDGRAIGRSTDLLRQVADSVPGSTAALTLWRQRQPLTARVALSEVPAPRELPRRTLADGPADGLGLTLGPLPSAWRARSGVDTALVVRDAVGLARSEGIRAGDLIVAVNGTPLQTVDEFRRLVAGSAPGQVIALLVMRDGQSAYVPLRMPRPRALAHRG